MIGGNLSRSASNFESFENDERVSSDFDDAREQPESNIPISINSITTGSSIDLAKDEEIGRKLYFKTIKAEQRVKYLGNLVYLGVGTKELNDTNASSIWIRLLTTFVV